LIRPPLIVAQAVVLVTALIGLPTAQAQSRAEQRLLQDRVLLEQLPGTISRALAALEPGPEVQAEIQRLFLVAVGHYTAGRTGEARRTLYQALAVVLGRGWTERDDYWRSLLLRTDAVVSDPARPLIVRLTQIYPTTYRPAAPLSMRASVQSRDPSGDSSRRSPKGEAGGRSVRDLGAFEGIGVEFVDAPYAFSADLLGLEDGRYYDVVAEVFEGEDLLRRLSTPVFVLSGLDSTRTEVERRLAAISGHDSAKATVRYPFDRALQANLGKRDPDGYDFTAGIEQSRQLLGALEHGNDPLFQAVGDHKRHYRFAEAREIMPYRILVPETYDGTKPYPLVVGLHGMGGTDDSLFEMNGGILPQATETRGFILVSPMGYRRNGAYGSTRVEGATASPTRRELTRLSQLDVMNVLELVRGEYEIDEDRIYLMGGSMGGGGTWRIASRYPQIWAAIAPICAGITLDEVDLEGMRHIPVVVSHGDADATVPVERSRTMVAAMEKLGMTYEYHEIEGGGHLILKESLQPTMEFLGRYRRSPTPDS
jgi:predicted esterase